ncbi:uncharacterized protein LOC124885688 [Capsicum annuum]|uniref:uncharacterized protein LOC124885688 n=1 Tax=Capsicum annuum TaxID=4072 RepID=UPI001FB09C93|nr:uncharacterized protein LOC124885688 [Capsicum annuum]
MPPQVGLDEEEKKDFLKVLDEVVRIIPRTKKIFMGGDFNGNFGSLSRGYDDVYGGFGFPERNEEEASLLDFSRTFRLWIANSNFSNKEEHLIIFYKSKKVSYAKFVKSKDDEERQTDKEEYKVARREAKLEVTTTKTIFFESLYAALERKDKDKKFYRLTKARK